MNIEPVDKQAIVREETQAVEKAVTEFVNAWNKTAYGKLTALEHKKICLILNQLNYVLQQENK